MYIYYSRQLCTLECLDFGYIYCILLWTGVSLMFSSTVSSQLPCIVFLLEICQNLLQASYIKRSTAANEQISTLQNKGFLICLCTGRHLDYIRTNYGIREANGCPHELLDPEVRLRRPSRYRCSVMYAAVSDISYIAEHVILGEGKWLGGETVGLKYPV